MDSEMRMKALSLGKATAAEAQGGVQELLSNPGVHPHAVGDLLDIGAGHLAQDGNGVDVGNLQREEGIGRVLDQFRGSDVGDNDGAL